MLITDYKHPLTTAEYHNLLAAVITSTYRVLHERGILAYRYLVPGGGLPAEIPTADLFKLYSAARRSVWKNQRHHLWLAAERGERGGGEPVYLGRSPGSSFAIAVAEYKDLLSLELPAWGALVDVESLFIDGRRLFDNEHDARAWSG